MRATTGDPEPVGIRLQAVVKVPVPGARWLRLHPACPDAEVGQFVEALTSPLDIEPLDGLRASVAALLGEDRLVVAGGLRVVDTVAGNEVVPGCCGGLEDWRQWLDVPAGGSPWMGHNPGPVVEADGDRLLIRQDGDPGRDPGVTVVMARNELPGALRQVHRDLIGFLGVLADWAARQGLGVDGAALVELVDRSLTITAALEPEG